MAIAQAGRHVSPSRCRSRGHGLRCVCPTAPVQAGARLRHLNLRSMRAALRMLCLGPPAARSNFPQRNQDVLPGLLSGLIPL